MAAELLTDASRATDSNSNPYAGATWNFYATGTLTPQAVYADAGLAVSLGSVVTADAGGKFVPIYFNAALLYRGILKSADGAVTIYDIDPVNSGVMNQLGQPGGSSVIGFIQAGSGAVSRTVQDKGREVFSVLDFGAVGTGVANDTAAIQAAADALTSGGTLKFPRGTYLLGSGVTISNDNVVLEFEAGAVVEYATPTLIPIKVTGDGCGIRGGKIEAPATFDGTNSAVTYSVVWVEGDSCSITGLKLNNVPRVGINFKDCNNGIVSDCHIDGGTTSSFFNGANTVHIAVNIDPPGTGSQGGHVVNGNFIARCVQGVCSGAIGAPSLEQAIAVSGNVFEECWNHGIYAAGLAHGWAVTGNAFSGCQVPVALTGWEHAVVGNSLTVQTTGGGTIADNELTGISLRDPVRCIVSNNVIKGEGVDGGVVIGLDDNTGVPGADSVTDNIVSNNVICITNTTVAGVIAIRLLSSAGNVANNIVEGNTISAPLRSGEGLISVQGGGSACVNNSIRGNVLSLTGIRGSGYGIITIGLHTVACADNIYSIQCDAGSAMTLTIFALSSNTFATVNNNVISCTSAWGANITVRCFQELTTGTDNFAGGNRVLLDPTKLAGQSLFFSPMIIDHLGTGTPEGVIQARVGSIWRRRDGGAATSLYIKESGTGNTGWIGK